MNDLQVVEQELSDAIMREMRQAMQTKNISLTLLADMSGVPLETVERLESGRLDVKLDDARAGEAGADAEGGAALTYKKCAKKTAKNSENPLDNLPILCYTIKR